MAGDKKDQEKEKPEEEPAIDFHGAAILDENGEEIPITEDMIQEACEKLDKNWVLKPDKDGSGPDQDNSGADSDDG